MSNLLKVENLSRSFGGIHANSDITFDVNEGEILGVIGPNGAGKSTLFDLITGFTKSDKGQVILRDKNITNIRPDLICRLGVGRTFQKLKPFADQTLLENVIVGALVGLVELVLKLKKNGITVVTIEHNMKIIMDISDRILALNQGKRIAFDTPKNISQNTQVIDAYLGTVDAA